MKLPTELTADTCWLNLARDVVAAEASPAHARDWRCSERLPADVETIETQALDAPLAAVRLLGEAPERASATPWCAAMDPVTLAADMRDVRIQSWPQRSLDAAASAELLAAAAQLLSDDHDARLRHLELISVTPCFWYLVGAAADALEFSATPAMRLPGEPLRHHRHAGADGALVRRLATEIQMRFHTHPANVTREASGLAPVNGVWMWGAGALPTVAQAELPPLLSDDPLWLGYWRLLARDPRINQPAQRDGGLGGQVAVAAPTDSGTLLDAALADPSLATVVAAMPGGVRVYRRRGLFGRAIAALRGIGR